MKIRHGDSEDAQEAATEAQRFMPHSGVEFKLEAFALSHMAGISALLNLGRGWREQRVLSARKLASTYAALHSRP